MPPSPVCDRRASGELEAVTPAEPIGAEVLFRTHHRFVTGFLVAVGVAPRDLDDMVQEVFLVAHRRGGFLPGAAKPTTWLACIALNVASTSRRSRHRRRDTADDDYVGRAAGSTATPEEQVSVSETLTLVQRALSMLDVEKRALFLLFEIEGETCAALAATFGIPVGTVYSRLHAARADFRRAYEALSKSDSPVMLDLARDLKQGATP